MPTIALIASSAAKLPTVAGQRAEHAELRAIVAIVRIEGVADEAAIAGLRAEQADLSLELDRGGGKQRNAERDAGIAHREAGREIVAAVDHQIMPVEQSRRIVGADPLLHRPRFHEAVEAMNELQREIGLRIAGVALAKERLAMQIAKLDHVVVDDGELADARAGERGDDRAADAAGADRRRRSLP